MRAGSITIVDFAVIAGAIQFLLRLAQNQTGRPSKPAIVRHGRRGPIARKSKMPVMRQDGSATIITAGPGRLRAATTPAGFFVRRADNSMEIVCSDCRVTAVEAGSRASWLSTNNDEAQAPCDRITTKEAGGPEN